MYIQTIVIKVPKKRFDLRVEVSEQTYNRVKEKAASQEITIKDWLYMAILKELNQQDIQKIQDEL